jgi:hypothetical protein
MKKRKGLVLDHNGCRGNNGWSLTLTDLAQFSPGKLSTTRCRDVGVQYVSL